MRLYEVAPKLGLTPNSQAMKIAEELTSKLEDHWNEDKGYYQSILEGQTKAGPLRGDTLDSHVIFACTYANMPCFDEKMLRTVAVLRKSFEKLFIQSIRLTPRMIWDLRSGVTRKITTTGLMISITVVIHGRFVLEISRGSIINECRN